MSHHHSHHHHHHSDNHNNANICRRPIAILIFNNHGYISHQAYMPSQYDHSNPNAFDAFLASVYNHISYDATNALNNHTSLGKLLEVHHRRDILIPLDENPRCYFSTYIHPHCDYKPIHTQSPLFFHHLDAFDYADTHSELSHMSCNLRFI